MAMAAPAVTAMMPEILGGTAAAGAAAAPAIAGMATAAPGIASLFGPAAGSLGASMLPAATGAASAAIPLGMATAAPGIAGMFGMGSAAAAPYAAGMGVNGAALARIGAGMLNQANQQPQMDPRVMQKPPGMQQPQGGSLPSPAMNTPAVGPAAPPGMLMHGMPAPAGMQDILRRLGMG